MTNSKTLQDLSDLAFQWSESELLSSKPKLVFLEGRMGSGKTTFVSKVAQALGAADAASPSFALHTRYESDRAVIDHFDLDRLESLEDLESIGFWDIVDDVFSSAGPKGPRFIMIEWASRLEQFGVGDAMASWTQKFRVWSFEFRGEPTWQVEYRNLRS